MAHTNHRRPNTTKRRDTNGSDTHKRGLKDQAHKRLRRSDGHVNRTHDNDGARVARNNREAANVYSWD